MRFNWRLGVVKWYDIIVICCCSRSLAHFKLFFMFLFVIISVTFPSFSSSGKFRCISSSYREIKSENLNLTKVIYSFLLTYISHIPIERINFNHCNLIRTLPHINWWRVFAISHRVLRKTHNRKYLYFSTLYSILFAILKDTKKQVL